jgi:serine/threonine-protein kinase
MELVDGVPLEVRLPRELPRLIECFIETAKALRALHTQGFVHCDLKPSNILITTHGHVKVIDLGQAAKIGTAKKRIQGTPDFIAPEQVKLLPVSIRTDVYNFGATMYWCLCGAKIPTLYTTRGKNSMLVDTLIQPPHRLNPQIPEPLSTFTMECTRVNPIKRPEDMTEVIRRLEIILHAVRKRGH